MKKTTFISETGSNLVLSEVKPVNAVSKNSQSGAVLIVAMIMLLIITTIGLSSVGSTSLEVQMAANAQFKNVIFQESENAIETALETAVGEVDPAENGNEDFAQAYSVSLIVAVPQWQEQPVTEASSDNAYLSSESGVQFAGVSMPKGEAAGSIRIGASGYSLYNYKVRGTAAMANVGASNTNVRGAYVFGASVIY